MRGAAGAALIAAGAALLTAGCGQKGPLYLPDKGGTVVTRTPAASQAAPAPPATPPKPTGKDQDQDRQPKP